MWLALGEVRVWRQDVAVRPTGEREADGAPQGASMWWRSTIDGSQNGCYSIFKSHHMTTVESISLSTVVKWWLGP
ncbi:hypothetical protein APR09_003048 [Nocardia amikacinitolerans]|nr:hypothetical protein [Nocardia amikacinitolerans]